MIWRAFRKPSVRFLFDDVPRKDSKLFRCSRVGVLRLFFGGGSLVAAVYCTMPAE